MTVPASATSHDLLLRGVRVHYTEAGEGPAVLLVHGFLMDHRAWREVIPRLATRYRVIAPDLPGFGASEKPSRYPYTREAFAETLCDLLAGLDVPRAHVVGHALGGAVALTLAADHPEYLDRLVVLDAMAYPFAMTLKARALRVPVLGSVLFKQLYGRAVFRAYFRNEVNAPEAKLDLAAVDGYYNSSSPPEAREAAWRTLQHTLDMAPLEPRLPKVRAPAAVLWGERDRLFPLALARRLAHDLGDCPLDVIPGAGHCPHEDHPEAVTELLFRHFAPAPASRASTLGVPRDRAIPRRLAVATPH